MPEGHSILQPRAFVFGQITEPLEIEPTGRSGIFAVRFHPHGFTPFATLALTGMENRAVPLTALFGDEGFELEKQILAENQVSTRIEKVAAFLLKRLTLPETSNRMIQTVIGAMFELRGQFSISDLTDDAGINRRQLERKFSSATGLSPKQLAKFIRLQEVLKNLLDVEKNNLTRVGYASDYYDQSHFIRDFKAFTGVSPKAFYADKLQMSALFTKKE